MFTSLRRSPAGISRGALSIQNILRLVGVTVTLAMATGATQSAEARQTHLFVEEFGSAAKPALGDVVGIAVDPDTGDVLVIDAQTDTVRRYNSDGTPDPFTALGSNVIDAAGSGNCSTVPADCDETPLGGFNFAGYPGEAQVAVDNSGTLTDGTIYVTQTREATEVDIFAATGDYLGRITGAGDDNFTSGPCGVAVDSSGNLFISTGGENRIYKYEPTANPPTNADLVATFTGVGKPCNLAAGNGPTDGFLFANRFFTFQGDSVLKLDAITGAVASVVDSGEYRAVAIDPATGHLFALHVTETGEPGNYINEYDVSGTTPNLISVTELGKASKVVSALNEEISTSFGDDGLGDNHIGIYGPLVTVPGVTTGSAAIVDTTSVTVTGAVNPDGVELSDCSFEYGLSIPDDPSSPYEHAVPCVETPAEIGSGLNAKTVHADLAGLSTETVYHFRLVAANPNGLVQGSDKAFKTPSKPEIVGQQVSEVSDSTARLQIRVNPGNLPTTIRVEWGADSSYGQSTLEIPAGAGDAATVVETELTALSPPGATFHWRSVATNSLGVVTGADRSFTTFPSLVGGLPDDRAYELVSPGRKGGAEVAIPGPAGGAAEESPEPLQASADGRAITYGSFSAIGDAQSAPATSQYLSRRSAGGWSTKNINPLFEEGFLRDPFVAFSPDLEFAAVLSVEPPLTPDATSGFPNIYVRDNSTQALTAVTLQKNAPILAVDSADYCLYVGGATPDYSHLLIAARGALNAGDPVADGFNLYEWSQSEGLQLVSILPSGSPAPARLKTGFGSLTGGAPSTQSCDPLDHPMRHVISEDGKYIFWTYDGTFSGAANPLLAYVGGSGTVQLDKPNVGVAGKGGGGNFWDASIDGSKVFFTAAAHLTADATGAPGAPDLYLYDFGAPVGARVTNLTSTATGPADVTGVVGASANGSYVYFVARSVLTNAPNSRGEVPELGKLNLYVWHDGVVKFVAADVHNSVGDDDPRVRSGRVTPDGRRLAFSAATPQTGYDNVVKAESACSLIKLGKVELSGSSRCLEIYRYDFETEKISCVSCNPSGANPGGPSRIPPWSTPYEQPRYLSDDGNRLFFDTLDSLHPRDTNGRRDVYEFELAGAGTCTTSSSQYVPDAGGCVFLISTGKSADETYLLDASASGDDLFISTRESLAINDEDERYDVYDVRVGGSSFQTPPPPCNSPEECRQVMPPPSSGSPPGSSRVNGVGNPAQKRCPKGKRKVTRKGKTRCIKRKAKGRRNTHGRPSAMQRTSG